MRIVHVIVKHTIVVEHGAATTAMVLLAHYGFYPYVTRADDKVDELNNEWSIDKALRDCHLSSEEHLAKFYSMYGVYPYDYSSLEFIIGWRNHDYRNRMA